MPESWPEPPRGDRGQAGRRAFQEEDGEIVHELRSIRVPFHRCQNMRRQLSRRIGGVCVDDLLEPRLLERLPERILRLGDAVAVQDDSSPGWRVVRAAPKVDPSNIPSATPVDVRRS